MSKIAIKPAKRQNRLKQDNALSELSLSEARVLLGQIDEYFHESYGDSFYRASSYKIGLTTFHRPQFVIRLKELFNH